MTQLMPVHFSDIMRDQFQKRALKNPSYSLRAFARDLDLTSGNLSEIMSKKAGISLQKAQYIATKLELENDEKLFFCKLAEANSARKKDDREKAEAQLWKYDTHYNTISEDFYRVISDWHHFALVELVAIKDFVYDHEWISKRLGISKEESEMAVERLIKVGLLELVDGKLSQTYDLFIAPSGTPSDAAKKFHRQVFAKASEAIITQKIEERDFSSGFFRVRSSELPKIAARIKDFRRELVKEIESGTDHDSVYAFSTLFFRGDIPQ